jgi:hypothetical protein
VFELQYQTSDYYAAMKLQNIIESQLTNMEELIASVPSPHGSVRSSGSGGKERSKEGLQPHHTQSVMFTDASLFHKMTVAKSALKEALDVLQQKIVILNECSKVIVGIQDFNIMKMIGKGGFAQVFLAKKSESSKLFAIKVS